MSTRITNLMTQRGVLSDLSDVANRLSQTQRKMSSGKDITKPSDDPSRANRAMTIRTDLEGIAQYKRNIGEAQAWQSAWTGQARRDDSGAVKRIVVMQPAAGGQWSATEWRWTPSAREAAW